MFDVPKMKCIPTLKKKMKYVSMYIAYFKKKKSFLTYCDMLLTMFNIFK